jgi:hypothetical protein
VIYGQSWLEQQRCEGINYTGQLTLLMQDVVSRVPTLSFINMADVLVFARAGRSNAEGAFATCHCLTLPASEPGYYFWRDRTTRTLTRRSEWFVTKSPTVKIGTRDVKYMLSFTLPRFCDQSLDRSRKEKFYPGADPWIAKLDTVVHELYHIDPEQNCLRRFTRCDGSVSDALHSATYFEDVAALVQQYIASKPDAALVEFLQYDFDSLRTRYGAVAGVTFRSFPSYPRRYREAVAGPALPLDLQNAPIEKIVDTSGRLFSDDDLQLREFTGTSARFLEGYTSEIAA